MENGNIPVTLTLSAPMADEIEGVFRHLANALDIAPQAYQICDRPSSPVNETLFAYQTTDGKEAAENHDIPATLTLSASARDDIDKDVLRNLASTLDIASVAPPAHQICYSPNSPVEEPFAYEAKNIKEAGENDHVPVTLTLSASARDDIEEVLRNLSSILDIEQPGYQICDRPNSPMDHTFFGFNTPAYDKKAGDTQSIPNNYSIFCQHCEISEILVKNNNNFIIKNKSSDFPGYVSDTSELSKEYYFCSSNCYMQFAITYGHGRDVSPYCDKAPITVVKHFNDSTVPTVITSEKQSLANFCKNGSARCTLQSTTREEGPGVSLTGSDRTEIDPPMAPIKKWQGILYKTWTSQRQNLKYKNPTEKELTEILLRHGITVTPNELQTDTRQCEFCHQIGDGVSDGPGRLLSFDVNKWVHINCALWSKQVYEIENGALVNVDVALKQSLSLVCIICKQIGASLKCFEARCTSVYHCACAVEDGCSFYKNKVIYCPVHIPKRDKGNDLTSLAVFRRVYVQRDENRHVVVAMNNDQSYLLRLGSLTLLNIGQLLPHQLHAFHTENYIYPVGYKIVRFYWSMSKVNKRCQYICSIHEVDGRPEFRIAPKEQGFKERIMKAGTALEVWLKVVQAVSKLRNAHDTIKIFPKHITGEGLFGLTEPAIVRVLESLPGIETLTDYHFKYGKNPLLKLQLPLSINPTGCARSESEHKLRDKFKRPHTQGQCGNGVVNWVTQLTGTSHTSLPSCVPSSNKADCPYSKAFVIPKSSQFKKMKREWRYNVYAARSKIQGVGLYANQDIKEHTMVIEYIGEIIRNELCDLREKKYELQNRGIYMFRIDTERILDATSYGGLARYINHSCNPNCVTETVKVKGDVHIIIVTKRRISKGEELTYNYNFEFEDDQHKMQCNCRARNCQRWMN